MAATTTTTTTDKVHQLFENLEAQKNLLTKCTELYKTLTYHFTNLQQSINSKTLTIDSKLRTLDSLHRESFDNLHHRESSIPERLISISSEIESKKESAIAEVAKPVNESAQLSEVLKSLCKRMDYSYLMRFVVSKRKEMASLRGEMREALKECVDPHRMVLETVREFLAAKEAGARGKADVRWACGVVVSGLFPVEELKEKKEGKKMVEFARKTAEEAEEVVREWTEKAGSGGEGGGCGMGSAEAAMFLQLVVGFGLVDKFEQEFYRNLVVEFAGRRDMAKLAIPIFGDKIADLVNQLVKSEKQVEAVYVASESGLAERFQPASLLKSYLRNSKKKTVEILKKGKYNAGATDEANSFEMNYMRSIVKCVEDHKLEAEFPIGSLKRRLSLMEKAKADKKKGSATSSSKPSNKRVYSGGGPSRSSGAPHPRPAKMQKFPSTYSSYGQRESVPRSSPLSPVSRYLSPYSLSSQTAYDPGLTVPTYGQIYGASHAPTADQVLRYGASHAPTADQVVMYGASQAPTADQVLRYGASQAPISDQVPRYGASHVPTADQVTQHSQQHVAGGSAPSPSTSAGPRLVSSYGLQSAYATYDYGTTTSQSYQPPYAQ